MLQLLLLYLLLLQLQLQHLWRPRNEPNRAGKNSSPKQELLLTVNDRIDLTTERIWRELSDRLRQFIWSKVASHADADDILQQVFLRIHQKLGDLGQSDRLEPWVFQIARNAIVDHYRSKRWTGVDDAMPLQHETNKDSDQNLNAEIAGCVAALIAHLPEDQRRAVTMYELLELSQKEIAAQESISVSGAKSRIQRGRKALIEKLHECCQFNLDRRGNVIDAWRLQNGHCESDGLEGVENPCRPPKN